MGEGLGVRVTPITSVASPPTKATSVADTSIKDEQKKKLVQEKLIKIRNSVLDLKIIFVKLDDEDDAYIIFEKLNTRGKDLSLADLVKNHISKHLKAKGASVDQPKIKWGKLLETIEGSSADLEVDTFLHHFWLSRYDYLAAKRLFKVLKRNVGKNDAKAILDALVADASRYRAIHEVAFWKWSNQDRRIVAALKALQMFRVQQQTPCVLSLMRSFKEKKLKKTHFENAVIAIEKFHFLFTAVTSQRSSGGISEMYASLGRRLFEATDTQSAVTVINELKTKLDNKAFKEKKKFLQNAGVSLPQEFKNLSDLTPADIQSRTAKLADLAYQKVWKI